MTDDTNTGGGCDRIGAGLSVLSGLLLACLFAPVYAWPLAPLAAAPLFAAVLLRARTPRQAAGFAFIAGLAFYPLSLAWMVNVISVSVAVFWPVFAGWLALHAWLLRGLWEKAEGRGAAGALFWALAAGLLWAGIEYFRAEVLWYLACPWLVLGYSQAPNLPLYQTLSVWGVYGLSALLVSCAAAAALLFTGRSRLPAALLFPLLAAASLWGSARLASLPAEAGRPVKVALVQAEDTTLARLAAISRLPAAARADLLVWPENAFMLPCEDPESALPLLAKELAGSGAVAAIGSGVKRFKSFRDYRRENFLLFLEGGRTVGRYHKMHPVPFVELGLKGAPAAEVIRTRLGALGPQICYDLAFEDGSRQAAAQGAELLVVPTLDPAEWGALQHVQHSDMTSARAVETGLWLVRAASSGRSQIVDPAGRVTAQAENFREEVLTGKAYLAPGGTFYTRAGWLFAPLALAAAALALGLRLARARRGD